MASAFGHAALAIGGSKLFGEISTKEVVLLGIICSILPDIDVISFRFGIPYNHWLGHRGFTHSIFFALCWSALMTVIFFAKNYRAKLFPIFLYLLFCTVTHGILDGMTTGGRGVGYFIPFNDERYFLPLRKILVSPIGIRHFFSKWGLQVIKSEIVWIGIPSFMLWIIGSFFNGGQKKTHKAK